MGARASAVPKPPTATTPTWLRLSVAVRASWASEPPSIIVERNAARGALCFSSASKQAHILAVRPLTAIRNAERLAAGFKFVATGHGPVGTVKDITAWRVYFDKLRTAVAAGLAKKQTLEQMQRDITMAEYSQWDGFDWVPLNVLGMYHFLTDTP